MMYRILCNPTGAIVCLFLAVTACSSAEQAATTAPEESKPAVEKKAGDTEREFTKLLEANRSKLSDLYTTQSHDIPEALLKKDTTENAAPDNPFDGYRIQILSTRQVQLADSISRAYRAWADTTLTGYIPKAYVFFKQPFYKVHIGDFQERHRAIKLSRILKRRYPEAWVVHDRINPSLVPADSISVDSLVIRNKNR